MRCLIRRVVKRGKESLEYRDSEVVADALTIGWASDQAIALPAGPDVEARHARLRRRRGGGLEIQSVSAAQLRVNGKPASSAALQPGDVIDIGGHRLTVLEEQPGFDAALLVEPGKVDDAALSGGAYGRKAAGAGWLSKSRLAWILTLGVLLITFAVPVAGLFSESLRDLLRDNPLLPSDALWDTGPLAMAHQTPAIGEDCNVCHRRPFRQVDNQACHDCHKQMRHHVGADSGFAAALSERSCTSCHKEHKEPGRIVRRDQGLCVDCHSDAQAMQADNVDLPPVEDFDRNHPQFRLAVWEPVQTFTDTQWVRRRIAVDAAELREQSNLKFNHKAHLNPEGVDSSEGREVMECADCHAEDAAGALMKPLSMAGECRRCHSLYFDENAPDREVPHGDVREVIATLEDYYSKLGLQDNPQLSRASGRTRELRRPGREARAEPGTVLEWARRQARLAGEDLLERSVCNSCHEVERDEAGGDLPWRVQPVKVNSAWMPALSFSHRKHRMQPCSDCHQAEASESSEDVLMPDIGICRDCHGGAASEARLGSRCVDCHDFHNRRMGPLYAGNPVSGGAFSERPVEEASGQ